MSRASVRWLRAGIAFILLTSVSGCGYSLAGRGSFLPAYIKVIGVPNFENHSAVFNVEQRISERVRTELIGRGKYKVQPDTAGADGVLTGDIQSISIAPAAFTDQRLASRYVLTLSAKIEFRDVKADKVIWSNPSLQFREEYDVTNSSSPLDPNAFFGQDAAALDRMASEFARTVVSAILEAF